MTNGWAITPLGYTLKEALGDQLCPLLVFHYKQFTLIHHKTRAVFGIVYQTQLESCFCPQSSPKGALNYGKI